jgi:aminoglycoside phosphotransferase (APT) family kinase protein
MTATAGELSGPARRRLTAWLAGHVPGALAPFTSVVLAGGNSNITVLLEDAGGQRTVLRRPPAGTVLDTAHDVLREARILRALGQAGMPVPRVIATCEDRAVLDAPFMVMEYIDGIHCHGAEEAKSLDCGVRRDAGESLARTLARLHEADVDAIGLGDLGRREDYIARQLRRWRRQVEADRQRPTPHLDAAHAILTGCVPLQRRACVVHGDVRLDNCILTASGSVIAVVDWEICALGDPLADLGVLLAYWAEPGDEVTALHDPPTVIEGFPRRAELAATYLAAAGLPADTDVSFYVAFAWWKLACIIEGVWARAARQQQHLARPLDSYADQALIVAAHAQRLAGVL